MCRFRDAAAWLLCTSVLGVIPTLDEQSQQPDLSGMSMEDLAKLKQKVFKDLTIGQ